MRHLVLAASAVIVIAALAGCGGERSGQAPTAGKGGSAAKASAKSTAGRADTTAESGPAAKGDAAAPATQSAVATAKAINTICPVTGLAVDPSIPPVEVVIDIVQPPMLLLIGANNAEAAKRIAADPERFAAAARNNREARDPRVPAAGAGQR